MAAQLCSFLRSPTRKEVISATSSLHCEACSQKKRQSAKIPSPSAPNYMYVCAAVCRFLPKALASFLQACWIFQWVMTIRELTDARCSGRLCWARLTWVSRLHQRRRFHHDLLRARNKKAHSKHNATGHIKDTAGLWSAACRRGVHGRGDKLCVWLKIHFEMLLFFLWGQNRSCLVIHWPLFNLLNSFQHYKKDLSKISSVL